MHKSGDKINEIEDKCLEALAVARYIIRQRAPYFSSVVYGFIVRMIPGIHTLGVSKGMVLALDPEWFVNMENEVLKIDKAAKGQVLRDKADLMRASVLVHEVMHFVRGLSRLDALRELGADPYVVNEAFDIPINDDLAAAGWIFPRWVVYSSNYKFKPGLTGEQYYELLRKQREQSGLGTGADSSQSPSGASGTSRSRGTRGDSKADSTGTGDGSEPGSDSGSGASGKGGGKGLPKIGAGHCGGCAGTPLDGELEERLDAEDGRSEADKDRIRKQAINDVREAESQGRGSIPASLKELIALEDVAPTVNWRSRLRHVLRRATGRVVSGQADFSMRRPSKRSYTRGVIRPSMVERKVIVAMVEDSSGSMGAEQLRSAREEACGVFKQLGISTAWFIDADAEVSCPPKMISMRDLAILPVTGRGGTDFRPAIAAAQKLVPKPDILIYFTDGDGVAPDAPPKGMAVVWCVVPSRYRRKPAEWGELIFVEQAPSVP